MEHHTSGLLLILGMLLVSGYLAGVLANRLGLPRITGYIVAGLILSPGLSGLISRHHVSELLPPATEMSLAIIAFMIGGSLKLDRLKEVGRTIVVATLTQGQDALVFTILAILKAGRTLSQLAGLDPVVLEAMTLCVGGHLRGHRPGRRGGGAA